VPDLTPAQTHAPHIAHCPAVGDTRSPLPRRALAALLSAGLLLTAAATASAQSFVSIKGSSVNVRETPSTRSDTLWELGTGYPLQVTQRKGSWLRVRDFESTLGWVYAPLTARTPHMVVTGSSANLRAGPGPRHKVVGKLQHLEVVRTLKKTDGWAQVQREGGQKGWVARRLAWGW